MFKSIFDTLLKPFKDQLKVSVNWLELAQFILWVFDTLKMKEVNERLDRIIKGRALFEAVDGLVIRGWLNDAYKWATHVVGEATNPGRGRGDMEHD